MKGYEQRLYMSTNQLMPFIEHTEMSLNFDNKTVLVTSNQPKHMIENYALIFTKHDRKCRE